MPVRWKTDLNKFVITSNFERRGWQEVVDDTSESEWDIYWASIASVRAIFSPDSLVRLRPGQLINHFPNHYELTRKDLLVKNVKRYQRQLRKDGAAHVPDLVPTTFVLPQEHAMFVEEFRRQGSSRTYIMKPASKAQGKGIFLINRLSQNLQVRRWSSSAPPVSAALRPQMDNYVVSRYIERPLLLGGKKFDLRLYVLVPCFRPLCVYMSTLGFAHFSSVKYSTEVAELDNMYVHLTNVAVQQESEGYNAAHGNKWGLEDMKLHLEAARGHAAADKLWADVKGLVVHSLKAVQGVMINDRHCFELYGFDVIVDVDLNPWLIEVNASPSLTTTTKADRLLKFKVISDTLSIVTQGWSALAAQPQQPGRERRLSSSSSGASIAGPTAGWPAVQGSMELMYDEAHELMLQQQQQLKEGQQLHQQGQTRTGKA